MLKLGEKTWMQEMIEGMKIELVVEYSLHFVMVNIKYWKKLGNGEMNDFQILEDIYKWTVLVLFMYTMLQIIFAGNRRVLHSSIF